MARNLSFETMMTGLRLTHATYFLRVPVFFKSLIFSYLLVSSAWAGNVDEMIDHVAGIALLKKHCSQCHGAPSAKDHKSDEWKSIVLRMQRHRLKRGFKRLSQSEVIHVSQFLEQASMTETTHSNNKMDSKHE